MIKKIQTIQTRGIPQDVPFKSWKFPAGEIGFRLLKVSELDDRADVVVVHTRLNDSDSIVELLMACDALKRVFRYAEFRLVTPLLPYARQDRVCVEGESFSLDVFSKILGLNYITEIQTYECHSKVSKQLLPQIKEQASSLSLMVSASFGEHWGANSIMVAPDKGAVERTTWINKVMGGDEIVVADKVRDPMDGKITGMSLDGDVEGKDAYVFDDMCQGGKTFIELHKLLKSRGANKIFLFVVHGMFSNGLECITDLYDHVFTTNSYKDFDDMVLPKNMSVHKVF